MNTDTKTPRTLLFTAMAASLMLIGGTAIANDPPQADHTTADHSAMADESSDQPINDTWITTKVKSSLLTDSDVSGLDVSVETTNGVVTLSGDVESQAQVDRAVQIAQDIEGVTRVDATALVVATATADR